MFLPLGDEPNPHSVPVATYALIGVNVAVFLFLTLPLSAFQPDLDDPLLAQYVQVLVDQLNERVALADVVQRVTAYDLVVFSYGFRPAAPDLTALFTSMFLHGGLMHLAGNMLFLWIYGDNVEHRLGPVKFLIAYLATGVVATLFHTVFDADSALPVVGASGAISGVLGFYFVWFPKNRVRLWVMLFPFFMNVITAPARLVLGMYLILDNLFPFILNRGLEGGGVAYGAHIGGFLGGLGYAWWAERRKMTVPPKEYRPMASVDEPLTSSTDAIDTLVAGGQFDEAARLYFRLNSERTRRVLTPSHSIAFGTWFANHAHPEAALTVFQRHLRDYPLGPFVAEAHVGAGLVQLHALGQSTAAYQHLVQVFDLDPKPQTERLARQALADISARK